MGSNLGEDKTAFFQKGIWTLNAKLLTFKSVGSNPDVDKTFFPQRDLNLGPLSYYLKSVGSNPCEDKSFSNNNGIWT